MAFKLLLCWLLNGLILTRASSSRESDEIYLHNTAARFAGYTSLQYVHHAKETVLVSINLAILIAIV